MRLWRSATLAFAVLWLGAASAQTSPRDSGQRGSESGRVRPGTPPAPETKRPPSLDDLFGRLAAATDETEAKGVAGLIQRRLGRSGSDTADLLMSRAGEALQGKDAALAVELLDRVTQLKPDWAEAWSRRATAFFLLNDPADALSDLQTALRLEPRLYDAWMAVGHIRMSSDDKRGALRAYRRALAIYPLFPEVKRMVDRLAPEIDGRDL